MLGDGIVNLISKAELREAVCHSAKRREAESRLQVKATAEPDRQAYDEGIREGRLQFRTEFNERAGVLLPAGRAQGRYPLALAILLYADLSPAAAGVILAASPGAAAQNEDLTDEEEVAAIVRAGRGMNGRVELVT